MTDSEVTVDLEIEVEVEPDEFELELGNHREIEGQLDADGVTTPRPTRSPLARFAP